MRAHPTYTTFEKRWQLPVYFQLRWKEIVTSLEEAMASAEREKERGNVSASVAGGQSPHDTRTFFFFFSFFLSVA